jgi:hypothetical protein
MFFSYRYLILKFTWKEWVKEVFSEGILVSIKGRAFHFIWHFIPNESRRNCSCILLSAELCAYVSEGFSHTVLQMIIDALDWFLKMWALIWACSWVVCIQMTWFVIYGFLLCGLHIRADTPASLLSPNCCCCCLYLGLCRFWFKPFYSFL